MAKDMLKLNVIAEVHLEQLELPVFILGSRKWFQCRFVQYIEKFLPAFIQVLHLFVAVQRHQFIDSTVKLCDGEESVMTEFGQYPSLCQLDAMFYQCFVLRFVGAGRHDGTAVVCGHLRVVGIDVGFIAVCFGDSTFEIIGNQEFRYAAEGFEHRIVSRDKVCFLFFFSEKVRR